MSDAGQPTRRADDEEPPSPMFSVTKGNPTLEELAAVVAVLSAARRPPAAGSAGATHSSPSGWSAYWRGVGAPLTPGPRAWRASGQA